MSRRAAGASRSRAGAKYRPHAAFLAATTLFATVFVTMVLSAFHAPSPHALPVGVVAPASAADSLRQTLDHTVPGGFDLRAYGSEAAARAGIADGHVDGAVIDSSGPSGGLVLLTAPAAGTAPTQALTTAFSTLATHTGQPLTVTTVAAAGADDSMGLSPYFLVLAVLIPSVAVGSSSALVFRRARPAWWLAAPVLAAVTIGLAAAGVTDAVSGLGHYAALAGIVALFSLSISAPTAALARIRPPLVSLAVLAFVVFGIPASGGPSGLAAFLPGFLRTLNPAMPLGLAADAVRKTAYFGGDGTSQPLWTLAAWAVAGILALALIAVRRRAWASAPVLPHAEADALTAPSLPSLIVGFDDSEPARRALGHAARLAAARREPLHVVYADHAVLETDLSGFAHAELAATRDEKSEAVAAAAAAMAREAGVDHTFERRQGAPTDVILAAAADLALLADHGTSEPVIVVGRASHAAHRVLGSVPTHLLARSPFPVLAIA